MILAKEAQDAIEARELAKLTYKRPQRQTALTRRANISAAAKRTGYVATEGHEAAIAYHVAQNEGWTETAPYDTHNSPVKRLVSTDAYIILAGCVFTAMPRLCCRRSGGWRKRR